MGEEGKENVAYSQPVTVSAGQIQFAEACHPPLVAGAYQVIARQHIKETQDASDPWNSDPYESKLDISVEAPRFTLDPAALHSVYLPANDTVGVSITPFLTWFSPAERSRGSEPWTAGPQSWGKPFLPGWLCCC